MTDFALSIGGRLVAGEGSFAVRNPANSEVVGVSPDASRTQLDEAVAAARAAFPAWAALSAAARREKLSALAAAIMSQIEPLKRLLTSEQGKPLPDAEMEIAGAAYFIDGTASLEIPPKVIEDSDERHVEIGHVPLGVVGAIAPWNYPVILALWKVGLALTAGNTVVLKPSPFTPLTTLKIGELAQDVLPPGVLNVVAGGDALGPWMTSHPDIDKISFTGSTATGRRVMQGAADTLKRVTLELGGNDAAIVMPDVDIDHAAQELFWGAFRNAGQICMASKRIYVHSDIYRRFAEAFVAYAQSVKVGDGAEQGTQIGPINNRPQFDRVVELIEDAKASGLTFLLGGEVTEGEGLFLPISVIDNPPEEARIVQEEQFGPIVPLMKFDDVEDVVTRANATPFGLGNSVWSSNQDEALAIARRLDSGIVWVNECQYLSPFIPFGGHKQSGIGVEGGAEGLHEFLATKTVSLRRTP